MNLEETAKSQKRREQTGWFDKYAPAHKCGIDIGCGRYPIHTTYFKWDKLFGDDDATFMKDVPDNCFEVVYTSHLLEHLVDPHEGLRNWFRILKPKGHLLISIPHRDLFEKRKSLPSWWNTDHKFFWLPNEEDPPDTLSLKKVIEEAIPEGELVDITVRDDHYEANDDEAATGEFSIEAIVFKSTSF